MIPTVRVKHPAGDSFMTINASDFVPGQHELWSEQAEGFDATAIRRPAAALDPAVRDAAAALCLRMVTLRRRAGGEPFAELPPPEQLAVLNGVAEELARAEAEFEEDRRERAAFEAEERAREAAQARQDGADATEAAKGAPEPPAPVTEPLRVGKGPRGLWFVFRGEERVSKGYTDARDAEAQRSMQETHAEIEAERAAAQDAGR